MTVSLFTIHHLRRMVINPASGKCMGWKVWFEKAWYDPVGSKVIAGLFLGGLGGVWYALRQLGVVLLDVDWGGFMRPVVEASAAFLQTGIPLWYVLFGLAAWYVGAWLVRRRKLEPASGVESARQPVLVVKGTEGALPELLEGPVSTSVLESMQGSLSVWALLTDNHNKVQERKRHVYIIAHVGNDGIALGNPSMAKYPNAWAIARVLPHKLDPTGNWRFFCNAVEHSQTLIASKRALSPGWRLFTVEWSKADNFIRLHVDDTMLGEEPFENWPQYVTGDFVLGKWSKKVQGHDFGSVVGPVMLSNACLSPGELNRRLTTRPKENM